MILWNSQTLETRGRAHHRATGEGPGSVAGPGPEPLVGVFSREGMSSNFSTAKKYSINMRHDRILHLEHYQVYEETHFLILKRTAYPEIQDYPDSQLHKPK
jgi:hypothetical protein